MYYRISKNEKNLFFGKKIAQVWAVTLSDDFTHLQANQSVHTIIKNPTFCGFFVVVTSTRTGGFIVMWLYVVLVHSYSLLVWLPKYLIL